VIAASLFDHPAVLILIAVVGLIRWLISNAKAGAKNTQPPPTPSQPIERGGETQSEEERIRKFLEALGQPAGSSPPTKVAPRPRAVVPKIFPSLPPLKTKPPPLPPELATPPPPPPLPARRSAAPTRTIAEFQVQDFARQTSSEPSPAQPRRVAGNARINLGTPQDLRTAIVLREVFGPPRSLQAFDLL
jgi:hypothetical protein